MFGLDPPLDPAKIEKVIKFLRMEKSLDCVDGALFLFLVFPFLAPLLGDPPKSGTLLKQSMTYPATTQEHYEHCTFSPTPSNPLFHPFSELSNTPSTELSNIPFPEL